MLSRGFCFCVFIMFFVLFRLRPRAMIRRPCSSLQLFIWSDSSPITCNIRIGYSLFRVYLWLTLSIFGYQVNQYMLFGAVPFISKQIRRMILFNTRDHGGGINVMQDSCSKSSNSTESPCICCRSIGSSLQLLHQILLQWNCLPEGPAKN